MLRVKDICEEKGVTLQMLAKRLNITYQSLWSQLSGNPTLSKLQDIASALDVDITALFDSSDKTPTGICPHCGKPVKIKLE